MKKILITGAEGFIGSHLVELLVRKKYLVRALILYSFDSSNGCLDDIDKSLLKKIKIVRGDIRDSNFVDKLTKGIDCIINLAALIGIPYSYVAPNSYLDTNLNGLLNILNSARKNKVKKIIQTSTSEVYGSGIYFPIDEKHPIQPQSPYAASKAAADHLAMSYHKSYGTPVAILRPFNVFGPRQSARAIIPTVISQLIDDKQKEIKVGNVNTVREFNYIEDTILAFEKAINNKKIIGKIINIGNGYNVPIKNIIILLKKISKCQKKIKIKKERIRKKGSEVERLQSSSRLAKKYLGWSAKLNNRKKLLNALRLTFDWYKKNDRKKNIESKNYII
jgi:NAD dependent epimerase/dehydratase